jgi:hypothetical protein
MIRRPIIWRPQSRSAPTATPPPGPGRRLTRHWPAVPGHARQAARRSSPERTAPAIASSRNVRTGKARQPGLPGLLGTPRRPRARTDHTSHSSPATCRSVAGSRPPQLHHIDCSPRQSALPARPLTATGHYRPAQSWPAAPVPSSRLGDVALRRPTRPAPGPGIPRGYHPRVPSLIQSGRSPARYRPGPPMRGPRSKTARNTSKRACRQIETRPPPGRASSSRSNEDDPWWVRSLAWAWRWLPSGLPAGGMTDRPATSASPWFPDGATRVSCGTHPDAARGGLRSAA